MIILGDVDKERRCKLWRGSGKCIRKCRTLNADGTTGCPAGSSNPLEKCISLNWNKMPLTHFSKKYEEEGAQALRTVL